MNRNIAYRTGELARYFAHNRIAWPQFYESERAVIGGLALDERRTVLDIGCGCGGLGLALRDQFGVRQYTGVEINLSAAEMGRSMNPQARILSGDILELSQGELQDTRFDVVFSLSCIDWNVRFADMLAAAWNHVRPGGHFVATFRLVAGAGCSDMMHSYQHINYEGVREGERAAYVVLNARALVDELLAFAPDEINAFGYWGPPSASAVTPYDRLCFCAFAIRRRASDSQPPRFDLKLPPEILDSIGPL